MLDESRGSDAVTCARTCACTRACTRACTCTCTCTRANACTNAHSRANTDTDTKHYTVFVCSGVYERCHLMWQPDANGRRNC